MEIVKFVLLLVGILLVAIITLGIIEAILCLIIIFKSYKGIKEHNKRFEEGGK